MLTIQEQRPPAMVARVAIRSWLEAFPDSAFQRACASLGLRLGSVVFPVACPNRGAVAVSDHVGSGRPRHDPGRQIALDDPSDYNVITVTTKTRIVRIGNSRGIRIPKTLLEAAELPEEVELHAEPGRLVVEAVRHARKGWAAAAQRMRARSDDRLLDESTATKFDREEWEWR